MIRLLYCAAIFLVLISCTDSLGGGSETKPSEEITEPKITVAMSSVNFSSEGGFYDLSFDANVEWTAEVMDSSADSWCFVGPMSGEAGSHKLRITTTANETTDERNTSIKIKAGNVSETVDVIQKQKDALTVTASRFDVTADGGYITVEVVANIDFEYEIDDAAQWWISCADTKSMITSALTFKIEPNKYSQKREGNIYITSGQFRETITVCQDLFLATVTQLKYESVDGNIVMPNNTAGFGADIISNEYDDGEGIITFDGIITAVGSNAFEGCTTLARIEIPEGITSIGDYAFAGCNSLEHISLASTILSIGNYAFKDCTGEIVINCDIPGAEAVNGEELGCFKDSDFSRVIITDWVTSIGSRAFEDCSDIKYVTVPSSIKSIGDRAFAYCGGELEVNCNIPMRGFQLGDFTKVTIGSKVTQIGREGFDRCSFVKEMTIPASIREIGRQAFYDCGGEITVNCQIPDREDEDSGIFYHSSFTKVTIGEGITKIGDYAFGKSWDLLEVVFPDSMTEIGDYAFLDCRNLVDRLSIPEETTRIGDGAFKDCCALAVDLIIPSKVDTIGYHAFWNCSSIKSLTLPENLTYIGSHAFANCTGITYFNIPENVEYIGSYAFSGCTGDLLIQCDTFGSGFDMGSFSRTGFTRLTFGEKVRTIAGKLFYNNDNLQGVTIGSNVKEIGPDAFYDCSNLHTVSCTATEPPVLGNKTVFNYNAPDRKIYVPESSIDVYKASPDWSAYLGWIEGCDFSFGDGSGAMENPNDDGMETDW